MSALPPLSSLAKYDDLMRCTKELTAGVAEERKLKVRTKIMKSIIFLNFFQSSCGFYANMNQWTGAINN